MILMDAATTIRSAPFQGSYFHGPVKPVSLFPRKFPWNLQTRKVQFIPSLACVENSVREATVKKPAKAVLSYEKLPRGDSECGQCDSKGIVLCTTCAGSGLYVDSILESQGIIVKVRCLGCGGSGSIMCPECGGRGHF
eukprot:TRINITY_DN6555_c0_g1_i1.p1 TRINITY_DN6555_c0_g1~~TRINITY_DN6555_c0_g1_i1.p1  ORF type:complete len:138 (-),score=11.27 TRINITY_DN6555_c0_g1_i1:161-574(-)